MRLWPKREQRGISMDDYVALLNQMVYDGVPYSFSPLGVQQTLDGSPVETISNSLTDYAQKCYQSNGIVFACMAVRQLVFSAINFQYRNKVTHELFGTPDLSILETPWVGGTQQNLLGQMEQDASLVGNSYWTDIEGEAVRMRPDWVNIILAPRIVRGGIVGYKKSGFVYQEGGIDYNKSNQVYFLPDEVAHYAPYPDPLANFRGMSWLTPVLREIQSDGQMTHHKQMFFKNAATPNMVMKAPEGMKQEAFEKWVDTLERKHAGATNAYKTAYVAPGVDVQVVGADMKAMSFSEIQGHGETRIAAAAGVPPIIAGFSEGLAAATYCLPYGEPVWTPSGLVPIGDLREGDTVWSLVDGKLEPRKVLHQSQTGEKAVYRIQTKNRVLHATGNHPVLVRRPGDSNGANHLRAPGTEWKRVDELAAGDRVVQVRHLPDLGGSELPDGEIATSELMQWIGMYLGDGSGLANARSAISLALPPENSRVFSYYLDLTEKLFGFPHIGFEERSFRFHAAAAKRRLLEFGLGGHAKTKRIPGWVYGLSRELRLSLLAGLVDSDGSVDKRGALSFQFANRELVEDVKALMVGCGIQVSNLYHQRYDSSVLPNPGLHDSYEAWAVVASSADEVADIPFADPLYRERVTINSGRRRRGGGDAHKAGLDDGLGFYVVRSITRESVEPVYDIEVEGGHSFVASGIVVHNSNYGQARRRFADGTMHPLWQMAAGALSVLVKTGGGAQLWYDARDVPFLREDAKDAASIFQIEATSVRTLVDGGWKPDTVTPAVITQDLSKLVHTGYYSVQLQLPLTAPPSGGQSPAADPAADTTNSANPPPARRDGDGHSVAGCVQCLDIYLGDDVPDGADVPLLAPTFGHRVFDYWSLGPGLAKWGTAMHKRTSLRYALQRSGVPERMLDRLTNDIVDLIFPGQTGEVPDQSKKGV